MKPVKELHTGLIYEPSVNYDFSQGYPEEWEYWEAARCDKCNKVLVGFSGEEQHADIDHESKCDGWVHSDGPMMNYYYPITQPDNAKEWAERIPDLPLCLVHFEKSDKWGLALTGGGMNLSWEICKAYMRLGFLPPIHFCTLPSMSGMKLTKENKWILAGCRRSLKIARADITWYLKDLTKIRKELTNESRT